MPLGQGMGLGAGLCGGLCAEGAGEQAGGGGMTRCVGAGGRGLVLVVAVVVGRKGVLQVGAGGGLGLEGVYGLDAGLLVAEQLHVPLGVWGRQSGRRTWYGLRKWAE